MKNLVNSHFLERRLGNDVPLLDIYYIIYYIYYVFALDISIPSEVIAQRLYEIVIRCKCALVPIISMEQNLNGTCKHILMF